MNLPAAEMVSLEKLGVLRDFRLVGILGVPLLATLVLLVCSKRHFTWQTRHR